MRDPVLPFEPGLFAKTLVVIRRQGRIETVIVGAKKNIDSLLRTQLDAILKTDTADKGNPGRG